METVWVVVIRRQRRTQHHVFSSEDMMHLCLADYKLTRRNKKEYTISLDGHDTGVAFLTWIDN
jgi:hypothetical protein